MSTSPSLSRFLDRFDESLARGTFIKLSLAGYNGTEDGLKSIHIRKIVIKRADQFSFTHRYKTRDIVKNYSPKETRARVLHYLSSGFRTATLYTADYDLFFDAAKNILKQSEPTQKPDESAAHDRVKKRHVESTDKPYLHALGITDEKGAVLKSAQDKFRQIDKYIEIVSGLIPVGDDVLRVVDMGAGKGYLTFALYDYLTNTIKRAAHVTGVEARGDLVALCNGIAAQSGFKDLSFVTGAIESFDAAGVDILIALHACDTATDDALAKGMAAGAALIIAAPCCHKQIRRAMESGTPDDDLKPLLRHGIFMERQAEMVTDALRALILEYHGYKVKVFEFISGEHTAKNVMITARRGPAPTPARRAAIRRDFDALKKRFGVDRHYLEARVSL